MLLKERFIPDKKCSCLKKPILINSKQQKQARTFVWKGLLIDLSIGKYYI
jgi:hypothetical protein